jgi:hypothetical protein
LNAVLNCEGHSGPVTVKFSNMQAGMQVLISPVISDPDQSNATWIFEKPNKIDLDPLQFLKKKDIYQKREKAEPFKILYFKFLCPIDCKFSADVMFKEELK